MAETMFLLDTNLGLTVDEPPWPDFLKSHGIKTIQTTDLPHLDEMVANHEPDLAFMPIADFHRLVARGDNHYRGFALATSKFTGTTNLPSVLVVRKDDSAAGLDDLEGSTYGYINKSCSSSYFPPAILLQRKGRQLDDFLEIVPTKAWQGQVDAVMAKQVRATMVPEDVWRTEPENAHATKIIGRYDNTTPALIVARQDLNDSLAKPLLEALVRWVPKWAAIYGPFRPFYYADVFCFFHDLDQLPPGM